MSEYILTDSKEQAQAYVAALDKMCGYPNSATKTWTSVNIEETKDGRFLVMLPDGVFAPALMKYIEARDVLPKDRQKEIAITASKDVVIKDQPLGSKEQTISKFAVVSDVVAKEVTSADTKPIEDTPIDNIKPK